VSAPQPTTGSGGALWAPRVGSGAEPRLLSHFLYILRHRTPLVPRKIWFSCPMKICILVLVKLRIAWKMANSTLKKWWWQSPPLLNVVVTSHHHHIQSCAYGYVGIMKCEIHEQTIALKFALCSLSSIHCRPTLMRCRKFITEARTPYWIRHLQLHNAHVVLLNSHFPSVSTI